ncbi:MAG: M20/M25/M40 family metallo-hydrolase [Pseudomonadota bacterium]
MNEALRDAVSARQEAAVELLAELVRKPTENPPGDTSEASQWLANALLERGHEVERHPVPQPFARTHRRGDVENLIVRRTFGPGPTVALHAPIDTLPAGSGWTRDPFGAEIKDRILIGRGARDSKGDLVAYVAVLEALNAAGLDRGTVELHLTADEESGGFLGPAFLLSQGLTNPSAVIAAGTSYQVIVGQEGVLHLEVVLRGRQAHASRPQDGADAIAAALPILTAIHAEAQSTEAPLTVGLLSGGRGVNVVADRARFTIDRRLLASEDGEEVETALISLMERAHAAHGAAGIGLECRRLLLADPVTPTPASDELAATLSKHAETAFARAVPVVSAPVVSGARHYAAAGIATALYGVGPPIVGEGVDFTGEEGVSLDDLERTCLALAHALVELTQ